MKLRYTLTRNGSPTPQHSSERVVQHRRLVPGLYWQHRLHWSCACASFALPGLPIRCGCPGSESGGSCRSGADVREVDLAAAALGGLAGAVGALEAAGGAAGDLGDGHLRRGVSVASKLQYQLYAPRCLDVDHAETARDSGSAGTSH